MHLEVQDEFKPLPRGTADREGLVVHRPRGGDGTSLILFAHGLAGRRYATWGRLPEFIFEDVGCDVGLFQYDTLWYRRPFRSTELTVQARILADTIDALEHERVVLVGHSLGGVLLKCAVRSMLDGNKERALAKLRAILLLATPQAGSHWLLRWIPFVGQDLGVLRTHNPLITEVNEALASHISHEDAENRRTIRTWALVAGHDFWVDRLSACLAMPRDQTRTIPGSHKAIVKPKSKSADGYAQVLSWIEDALSVADRDVTEEQEKSHWLVDGISEQTRIGNIDTARELVVQAEGLDDPSLSRRAQVALANALLVRLIKQRDGTSGLTPANLTDDERNALLEVKSRLQPSVELILARGLIDSDDEALVVSRNATTLFLLGEREACEALIPLMSTRTPIPLELARTLLRGMGTASAEHVNRLLEEHPDSIDAKLLAAQIEETSLERPESAFTRILELAESATDREERLQIWGYLSELATTLGASAQSAVRKLEPRLLEGHDRIVRMKEVQRLFSTNKTKQALDQLEELRDDNDADWLQLRARAHKFAGEDEEALTALVAASERLAHPNLLRAVAEEAIAQDKLGILIPALEKLVSLTPRDVRPVRNLAHARWQRDEYEEAAVQFAKLAELEPTKPEHLQNQAAALLKADREEEALHILDALIARGDPTIGVILDRAKLLLALGRAELAFSSIEPFRDAQWENIDYLQLFMSLAYASGNDANAPDALSQIQALQESGRAEREIVQPKKLEDLVTFMEESRQQDKARHREYLHGKIPWTLVELLRGNTPYLGHEIRTQEVDWVAEEPDAWGHLNLYASNSFYVRQNETGATDLARVGMPSEGTAVVSDLSALITLHRLRLLDEALTFLGGVSVPADYSGHLFQHLGRLFDFQPSQRQALDAIRAALDDGTLIARELNDPGDHPLLAEYDTKDGSLKAADVVEKLADAGVVDAARRDEVGRLSRRENGHAHASAIQLGQPLRADYLSLKALHQFGVMESVLGNFQVHMDSAERETFRREYAGYEFRDGVRERLTDLREAVRSDARITRVRGQLFAGQEDGDEKSDFDLSVGATLLADRLNLPLLADDRFCQGQILNSRRHLRDQSFGSDALLAAMAAHGAITQDAFADAVLQLVRWRYRFLVVPAAVLYRLAAKYAENLPGVELRDVAAYVHDCMRDPGLFTGPEPTEPPRLVATSFYQAWVQEAAEFIALVWAEGQFPQEAATSLTDWIVSELLPSPPRNMGVNGRVVAKLNNKMLLTHLLLSLSAQRVDPAIGHRAASTTYESLAMAREDAVDLMLEIVGDA